VTSLRIVEKFPAEERVPGMMWRYPPGDLPDRECWWIVLPNTKPTGPGYPSQISWRTTDRDTKPPHSLWSVSGEAPNLTVRPSIDVECWIRGPDGKSVRDGSHWHGWITDGQLSPA
jgi:hypothetical protein